LRTYNFLERGLASIEMVITFLADDKVLILIIIPKSEGNIVLYPHVK
jgi:hypothetical protein